MEVILILAINLGIGFLIAKAGEKRKIGFGWSFFFCIFLNKYFNLETFYLKHFLNQKSSVFFLSKTIIKIEKT